MDLPLLLSGRSRYRTDNYKSKGDANLIKSFYFNGLKQKRGSFQSAQAERISSSASARQACVPGRANERGDLAELECNHSSGTH
jgi:hypothetical protein